MTQKCRKNAPHLAPDADAEGGLLYFDPHCQAGNGGIQGRRMEAAANAHRGRRGAAGKPKDELKTIWGAAGEPKPQLKQIGEPQGSRR